MGSWAWQEQVSYISGHDQGCETVQRRLLPNRSRMPDRDFVPVPTTKSIAAIVTVASEGGAASAVLKELARLPLDQTIVVVSDHSNNIFSIACANPRISIIHDPQP